MRFILKVLRGEGAREREIDQRARKPGREGRSAGELSSRLRQGSWSLGERREGKEAEIPTFLMFLFSSSVSLHPNPAALGPWQLHRLEKQAGKKEQHDPTCLKEGKTL